MIREIITSVLLPDEIENLLYKSEKNKKNGQQTSSNRCCEWTKTNGNQSLVDEFSSVRENRIHAHCRIFANVKSLNLESIHIYIAWSFIIFGYFCIIRTTIKSIQRCCLAVFFL